MKHRQASARMRRALERRGLKCRRRNDDDTADGDLSGPSANNGGG